MKKNLFRFLIACFVLAFSFIVPVQLNASAPYITETVNRYDEMVETQTAYEPIKSMSTIEVNGIQTTISSKAQDLFIDAEDYLYLADTGNKRILIMDKDFNYINVIDEENFYKEVEVDKVDDNGNPVLDGLGNPIKEIVKESILKQPYGLFVRDNLIYVADYGTEADLTSGRIHVFTYDKTTNTIVHSRELGCPDSDLLKVNNFKFRPQKIAVDANLTMYIVCQGSSNGILLVNKDNRFLNFFAPNQTEGNLWDTIKYLLYANNEKAILTKKIPTPPTNVMLDDSGYIYTVTSTIVQNNIGDTLKKVNIGGVNMYPTDMTVAGSFIDSWSSDYKTIYSVTSNGFIYEYDVEGNLLFRFAGPSTGDDKLGLFQGASSIAVDSEGLLYIVDPKTNAIQIFQKTTFTSKVHDALVLYMSGKYTESKDLFEEVLRYNSMFDLAHKAIGLAYYVDGQYELAMEKFEIAYAKEDYSKAFWEVRNDWLMENLGTCLFVVIILIIAITVFKKLQNKYGFMNPLKEKIKKFCEKPAVSGILVMKKFITKPMDAVYEVRYYKNIKAYNGIIWLFLVFLVYIFHITCTGFLFNNIILEKTILLKETLKIILPIVLFIISNYLISSLMGGDGTMKSIFVNTLGSLTPVIIMLPFIVIISNVLTYNESFIYYFGLIAMLIWTVVLLFVVMKETHNYTFKQTVTNFILTFLMMFILIVVCILLYLIIYQVCGFFVDLVKEAIF